MATPEFVLALREKIGTAPLWLTGVTAVVVRDLDGSPRTSSASAEILLVKRSDTGAWTPVTGIIDPGEQPAAAAAREVLEEADLVVVPVRLARIGVTDEITYPNGDRAQYIDHTFVCRYVSGAPRPADGENTEARWFAADAMPAMSADMTERVTAALTGGPEAAFSV
ncbi:ADP-ribose pyrophosphatase YjhB (NUDIX family) [Frondihabitans sp. PhB188]|uniref:NUDIX hydrolase n=1 Tax=Frondihabitans sp. PhB188 TaxID=2485200 RepID=UPI000F475661|nr:NUDIX domain-containing protein [Frondihabitans sp. PhB188]ROQ39613.1 ADP-ribose pyrophosphatase YjhB (NUDIX family) [Frondihabitans sp. PhB188]